MRNLAGIAALVVSLFFLGCEQYATFTEPQPKGVKSLEKFPERLKGLYFAANQLSILYISDSLMVRTYDYNLKCHKDSLMGEHFFHGDTLVFLNPDSTMEFQKITMLNDSEFLTHEHYSDTLFNLADSGVLKKFKGYYFLNEKIGLDTKPVSYAWEVRKLAFKKGVLTLGFIDNARDIDKLREITETAKDTTSFKFSPTRKQFKEFVEEDGFNNVDTFYRMPNIEN